ncbi:MAG: hypothetical protein ACI85O_001554 [Saprospiraceae bacterium]|jgi:hypothetical protein
MRQNALKITFIFLAVLQNLTGFAQQFTASASDKEVTVNQPFEVIYTLKNINGRNFTPPNFGTAKVAAGPSQSSSTTIVNGRQSSELSLNYTLIATETGTLNIGAASIQAGSKTMRSNTLRLEVKKEKKLDLAGKGELPDVFVRLEVDTEKGYTGQQILLDYRLYTAVDIQNINVVSESEYEGFFFETLRRFNKNQTRQKINGKEYITQLIRRIALFPQQSGVYEIEPSQVTAQIVTGQRRSGFFTFSDTKPVYLTTESVTINVESLPSSAAPPSFTGAVGDDFEVDVSISRNTLTTDDVIALRMTIRGNGDIKRVQPPVLDFGDNFEVYEPKVLQEENYENRGELYGRKIVEYLVLPKKPGRYQLQADFTYFHPDSMSYQTAYAKTPSITIKQGTNKGKKNINISPSETIADNSLRPNKTTASFSQKGSPFFGSTFFWILTILPVFGFMGALFFKKKEAEKNNVSVGEMKMREAVRVAREKLSAGNKYMEQGNSRAFYDEVQRAFLGYVSDKLQIPPAEMSKSNVQQKLQDLKVSENNVEAFIKILETCEMALFAGMDNSAAMSETYQSAEQVIVSIEDELANNQ